MEEGLFKRRGGGPMMRGGGGAKGSRFDVVWGDSARASSDVQPRRRPGARVVVGVERGARWALMHPACRGAPGAGPRRRASALKEPRLQVRDSPTRWTPTRTSSVAALSGAMDTFWAGPMKAAAEPARAATANFMVGYCAYVETSSSSRSGSRVASASRAGRRLGLWARAQRPPANCFSLFFLQTP